MNLRYRILLSLSDNLSSYKANYKPYNEIYQTLNGYSRSSVRADINFLLENGDVEKIIRNGTTAFSLTLKGFRTVSLKFLKQHQGLKNRWDGKWRIIIFDVPETNRRERDRLRSVLKRFSFGKITNSVYVSPFNNIDLILNSIKNNKPSHNIFAFETIPNIEITNSKKIANLAFNLDDLAKKYIAWIKESKEVNVDNDILILYYDSILESDPALPEDLLPISWPFLRSWNIFIGLVSKKPYQTTK